MKRFFLLIILLVFIVPVPVLGLDNEDPVSSSTTSAIVIEESTGKIIYEKNKDKEVAVASMTKMVAMDIILDYIEKGKIKWDDIVTVSKNAADMGGSQIYLQDKEKMTVRDLFKGISMASANDATVAMAEYIAGSEEEFVKMMNKRIKSLGLKHTNFKNCTGLDEDNHYSSAWDMAMIAKKLLTHDEILKFSSVYEDYLRKDTPNKFWLVNTNKLIRFYDKADGLKTGHTDNAKYCIAATAKRNDLRIIVIVLGSDSAKLRNSEASDLLDYGFNNTNIKLLHKKNTLLKRVKVPGGNMEYLNVLPKNDVAIVTKKNENYKNIKSDIKIDTIKLPIKKGDTVGSVIIKANDKVINKVPLIADNSIKKLSFIELFIKNFKSLVY